MKNWKGAGCVDVGLSHNVGVGDWLREYWGGKEQKPPPEKKEKGGKQ